MFSFFLFTLKNAVYFILLFEYLKNCFVSYIEMFSFVTTLWKHLISRRSPRDLTGDLGDVDFLIIWDLCEIP